jgi:hypothetical protein
MTGICAALMTRCGHDDADGNAMLMLMAGTPRLPTAGVQSPG